MDTSSQPTGKAPKNDAEGAEFKAPTFVARVPKKPINKPTPVITETAVFAREEITGKDNSGILLTTTEHNQEDLKQSKPQPKPQDISKYKAQLDQLNYKPPAEEAPFDTHYSLEVLKSGAIVDRVHFSKDKTYFVIGRIPGCDIVAENPTVSRLHAILQFSAGSAPVSSESNGSESSSLNQVSNPECKERGLYLCDLNSTHGTWINKNQLYPRRFYRLRVGHMIKFGNSSRLYIVAGPPEDEEEESEKSVTELLKERLEKELERKRLMLALEPQEQEQIEDQGINWGMGEDAEEETDLTINPYAANFESVELQLDNPKKTLAGWFDREGYDLHYDLREKANGHFICRVNLPLDGPGGTQVFAEVDAKGKKKEIVTHCALQACQILDKYGVLRQSHHEGFKRKVEDWEEKDYYSSDEDIFLDRTGSIEQKRKTRMKKHGKLDEKAESFESLNEKFQSSQAEIDKMELKIKKAEMKKEQGDDDEIDPLEAFMQTVKSGGLETKQMKSKLKQLREEQDQIRKLIEIARPANISLDFTAIKKEPEKLQSEGHTRVKKKEVKPEDDALQTSSSSRKRDSLVTPVSDESSTTKSTEIPNPQSQGSPPLPSPSKKIKIVGPQRPLLENVDSSAQEESNSLKNAVGTSIISENPGVGDETNDHHEADNSTKKKKKRHRLKKDDKYEYDVNNPDYSVWVPPSNQAGDGRTSLNDKLGY